MRYSHTKATAAVPRPHQLTQRKGSARLRTRNQLTAQGGNGVGRRAAAGSSSQCAVTPLVSAEWDRPSRRIAVQTGACRLALPSGTTLVQKAPTMLALVQLCTVDPPQPVKITRRHPGKECHRPVGSKKCVICTKGSNSDVNTTSLCTREAHLPAACRVRESSDAAPRALCSRRFTSGLRQQSPGLVIPV